MIDGDIEEALNLSGVEVDEEGTIGAGGGEQISNEFGADGDARAIFSILASVSVIRNDNGDAGSGCTFQGVDDDEELDEVLVNGVAGGLYDEDVDTTDIFEQLEVDFAIGEALQLGFTNRDTDVTGDLVG